MVDIAYETLVDAVQDWAARTPAAVAQTHVSDLWRRPLSAPAQPSPSESLTYRDLDRRARAVAASLLRAGVAPGERALLLYPPGLDFTIALLGCMYAAVIPTPVPLPRNGSSVPRIAGIVFDATPRAALTTAAIVPRVETMLSGLYDGAPHPTLCLATDTLDAEGASDWVRPPTLGHDTTALLQYTSGSSAAPKGVIVTQQSLLENERLIARAFGHSQQTVVVAWLPTFHDMGLIGNTIQPLCLGATSVSMSPLDFLRNPLRWLQMISHYRGTTSGAPNFAYDHCVRRIGQEQKAELDLSSWRVAYNGAEPIHPATLDRFSAAFEAQGFDRSAFFPCYGLAEATLFVSGAHLGPERDRGFDRAALEQGCAARSNAPDAQRLIGCGGLELAADVAVVDPKTRTELPQRAIGEIWVRGKSVASGYWGQPELTQAAFGARLALEPGQGREPDPARAPFLRTGDLGFVDAGELYITGRLTDLIIIRGRNIYPQDVERLVQAQHHALNPDCGAAFTVRLEDEDEDLLVVVQEVARHAVSERAEIVARVREVIARTFDTRLHDLALIAPGSIPRTSSGKVRRRACRTAYAQASLGLL